MSRPTTATASPPRRAPSRASPRRAASTASRLGLVTQRPSELAVSALSQCGTLFALRMGNELDQRFVANSLPEAAHGMVGALPSMRPQEAIVVGEGAPLPMRIRFDDLPQEHRPRSRSAEFSTAWQADSAGTDFLEDGLTRWRMQARKRLGV